MGRICTVCSHESAFEINEEIVRGEANRAIARQHGVDRDAVRRHKDHIPKLLVKAAAHERMSRAEDLIAQVEEILEEAREIIREARDSKAKDNDLALRAMDRIARQIELQAKILQIIKTQPQVNILGIPEVSRALEVLTRALEPYPHARIAASAALIELEEGL